MSIEIIGGNGFQTLRVTPPEPRMDTPGDALALIGEVLGVPVSDSGMANAIIIDKESVGETFFDLRSGVAGEILQKFTNYRIRLAVIGDFSAYTSRALRDFIYESNKARYCIFVDSVEAALDIFS